jgi:hypothetical protein
MTHKISLVFNYLTSVFFYADVKDAQHRSMLSAMVAFIVLYTSISLSNIMVIISPNDGTYGRGKGLRRF